MTVLWPYARLVDGRLERGWHLAPDLAAGNAQFFDPDPACVIQLRPLTRAEVPALNSSNPPNGLLYARTRDGSKFAAFIRLPPARLKNDRAGIMNAIECVGRVDLACAIYLCELAARTRWPRPATQSWTG